MNRVMMMVLAAGALAAQAAYGVTIQTPPDAGGHLISANRLIGQTFTAPDPYVALGLYIQPSTAFSDPDHSLQVNLYQGWGTAGTLMDTRTITPPSGFAGYLDVDYSAFVLSVSGFYSVTVDTTHPYWLSMSSETAYGGGDKIVQGVIRPDLPDAALHMVSSPNPLPEPTSGLALLLLAGAPLLRRRKTRKTGTS